MNFSRNRDDGGKFGFKVGGKALGMMLSCSFATSLSDESGCRHLVSSSHSKYKRKCRVNALRKIAYGYVFTNNIAI